MKQRFLFTSLLIISSVAVIGQSVDLKESFLEAESYFLFEEYNEALPLYLRIHRADPENDNIKYKIGVCLLNDPYQKDRSIPYLLKASKNINPKYKINNFKERTAPPEAFFYLGNAYLVNDSIDQALGNYLHFRDILDEKIYDMELVEEKIRICERARYLKTIPVDYDIENLGETINTRFTDINPIVSGNGERLVYVSKMQFYDATYFSEKVDGVWQPPRNIIPELGVDGDVYPTSLSWDGNTMIIYRNDDFIGNLYVSDYKDGRWTNMEKLGDNINTKYWESHGTLSRDGKTLYFTSNRKGGFGGLDIYKSSKLPNGSWGLPINLGPNINSRYNEETPFITENGKIIYFSSYGHYNMGGYDVFYSMADENGEWGEPINLGYPINSTDDDIFYYPVNNGDNAYFAKYMEGGFGRHDLYYMDVYSENNPRIYVITGALSSDRGGISESDSVMIYLIDRITRDTVRIGQPDYTTQTFELKAPQGEYDLRLQSMTFHDLEKQIRIDEITDKNGIRIDEGLNLETKPYEPLLLTGESSRIEVKDTVYFGQPGKKLRIRMDLRKGSVLTASHTIDSNVIATDTFEISRERFVYEIVPEKGTNIIDLIMEEKNGDRSTKQLIVYTESEDELLTESGIPDTGIDHVGQEQLTEEDSEVSEEEALQLQNEIDQLAGYAEGDLQELIQNIDPAAENIRSMDELFKYLEQRYGDRNKIEELKAIYKAEYDVEKMLDLMRKNSERELRDYLEKLDLEKENITTVDKLLRHLRNVAEENGFNENDINRTFKRINGTLSDTDKTLEDLISYAKDDLYEYLRNLDPEAQDIQSPAALLDHLAEQVGQEFEPELLISVMSDMVSERPVESFVEYLKINSPKELRELVKGINLEKEGIDTMGDLISYLLRNADQLGLTAEELQRLLIRLMADYAIAPILETEPILKKREISTGMKITGGLLITGVLFFIILFLKKKRRKKDTE